MASAHHAAQHSRYSLPPPPGVNSDFRLPSLKDLNFQYRPPPSSQEAPAHGTSGLVEPSTNGQEHPARHVQSWRPNPPPPGPPPMPSHQPHPHQQHTPPLSAGHEISAPKVEYSPKHDHGGYLTPGIPLSAQITPVPGSVNIGPGTRGDDTQHQSKRPRPSSSNMPAPRDMRSSHPSYAPQYPSYPPSQPPPVSPIYQIPQGVPGPPSHHPPPHEQMHHHAVPVPNHPGYPGYQHQQQYMQARPPNMHPQHPSHPPQPQSHGNPYPSPGPPPPAPPPQSPWEQQQPQHHPQSHHQQQQPQPQPHHHHQLPPPPPQHPPQSHPHHSQHVHVQHHQQQPPPLPPPPPPPQHPHMHPQQQQQQQQQQHSQHPQHHQHPPPPHHPQQHQQHPQQHPQQHSQQHPQQHPQQHQQQQQQQHHQPPPPPPPLQHQPQMPSFGRTTAIVPTSVETRAAYPTSEATRVPSARESTMNEIIDHCRVLYSFASRYAQLQASLPHAQPSPAELADMSQRAHQVVRLLEEYRRLNLPENERAKMDSTTGATSTDDHRPPKRPWEDMSQDGGGAGNNEAASFSEQYPPTPGGDKAQTTAEQDMELIRTKRATSAAGGSGTTGQPKSKYRKRSRATPPGKCHSCNIRETPEWRRGPDGARTLCNACGLHYAKLMRKRDKAHNGNGEAPRIDMETLRASARAADLADKTHSRSSKQAQSQQSDEPASPMESVKHQTPQQHHQGSFQLVTMMATPDSSNASGPSDHNRIQAPHPHQGMAPASSGPLPVPPPPWASTVQPPTSSGRGYAPELQHQSFMRSSQHPGVAHTSPR